MDYIKTDNFVQASGWSILGAEYEGNIRNPQNNKVYFLFKKNSKKTEYAIKAYLKDYPLKDIGVRSILNNLQLFKQSIFDTPEY